MHPTGGTSGTGCAALQEKGNKWFEHRRKLYDKAFKFCKDNAARLEVALTLNDAALMKAGVKDEELRSTILTVLREWFNHCCSCMDGIGSRLLLCFKASSRQACRVYDQYRSASLLV